MTAHRWWCEHAEDVRRVGVVLAALSFVAAFGVAVGMTLYLNGRPPEADAVPKKSYSRLVAEGVRYRDYQNMGVDRIAFKSCRIEKRRRGAITFGAFNVLVVDGLLITIPAVAFAVDGPGGIASEKPETWLTGGLVETLLRSQGQGAGRFSGVRINGLTVNRSLSNRVERVFSAEQAESGLGKDALRLRTCVVFAPDGAETRVNDARLVLKPSPTLIYMQSGAECRIGL